MIYNRFRRWIPRVLALLLGVFIFSGCHTTKQVQSPTENKEDMGAILSAVAGALSGKHLSEEELRNLEKQIRTDEEAQTAIQVITDSVGGKEVEVKYCPITGRRYASHMEVCPEHQIPLEVVSQ